MPVLSKVKKDMEFYRDLASLLKVLKGVAVSQFHILERKMHSFYKFSQIVEGFIKEIDTRDVFHPFVKPQSKAQAVVAVTSDSGLLGGLNTQVMAAAFNEMKSKDDVLIIVGERGKIYAQEAHISFKGFPGFKEEVRLDVALTLRDYVLNQVMSGKVGQVKIIYPRANSLTEQHLEKFSPIPYGKQVSDKEVSFIDLEDFIQESSLGDIVEYLVYFWMGKIVYELLGQARLAELAARFMHLEQSSQKLEDLEKELRLKYLRVKHELTDRSMREIFAARLLQHHN